jgi:hypothetical protein
MQNSDRRNKLPEQVQAPVPETLVIQSSSMQFAPEPKTLYALTASGLSSILRRRRFWRFENLGESDPLIMTRV